MSTIHNLNTLQSVVDENNKKKYENNTSIKLKNLINAFMKVYGEIHETLEYNEIFKLLHENCINRGTDGLVLYDFEYNYQKLYDIYSQYIKNLFNEINEIPININKLRKIKLLELFLYELLVLYDSILNNLDFMNYSTKLYSMIHKSIYKYYTLYNLYKDLLVEISDDVIQHVSKSNSCMEYYDITLKEYEKYQGNAKKMTSNIKDVLTFNLELYSYNFVLSLVRKCVFTYIKNNKIAKGEAQAIIEELNKSFYNNCLSNLNINQMMTCQNSKTKERLLSNFMQYYTLYEYVGSDIINGSVKDIITEITKEGKNYIMIDKLSNSSSFVKYKNMNTNEDIDKLTKEINNIIKESNSIIKHDAGKSYHFHPRVNTQEYYNKLELRDQKLKDMNLDVTEGINIVNDSWENSPYDYALSYNLLPNESQKARKSSGNIILSSHIHDYNADLVIILYIDDNNYELLDISEDTTSYALHKMVNHLDNKDTRNILKTIMLKEPTVDDLEIINKQQKTVNKYTSNVQTYITLKQQLKEKIKKKNKRRKIVEVDGILNQFDTLKKVLTDKNMKPSTDLILEYYREYTDLFNYLLNETTNNTDLSINDGLDLKQIQSHDLNNPLYNIKQFLYSIKDGNINDDNLKELFGLFAIGLEQLVDYSMQIKLTRGFYTDLNKYHNKLEKVLIISSLL